MVSFTKDMKKLHPSVDYDDAPEQAILIAMRRVKLEELPKEFIHFDTQAADGTAYPLPVKGDYILLIYFDCTFCDKIFPTLRRYTPKKWDYYSSMLNKVDLVKIGDDNVQQQ